MKIKFQFFFQRKLRCCFFQIWAKGDTKGDRGTLFWIELLELFDFCQKLYVHKMQNSVPHVPLSVHLCSDLEKATSQLSLEKNNILSSKLINLAHFEIWLRKNAKSWRNSCLLRFQKISEICTSGRWLNFHQFYR